MTRRFIGKMLIALGIIIELVAIAYLAIPAGAVPVGIAVLVAGLAVVFAGIVLLRERRGPTA